MIDYIKLIGTTVNCSKKKIQVLIILSIINSFETISMILRGFGKLEHLTENEGECGFILTFSTMWMLYF